MTDDGPNIAGFYEGWRLTNDRLIEALAPLSAEELAWRPGPEMWPIWALAGHLAGGRVYWLCSILKEPGAASTPFTDPSGDGWEDHPSEPRGADDLVFALRTSWAIVEDCLRRWSPEMLRAEFERVRGEVVQVHTRQSVLIRLITHDAYHCGEISQLLGVHGRPDIDIWSGLSRVRSAWGGGRVGDASDALSLRGLPEERLEMQATVRRDVADRVVRPVR